jgi:hypothetical protein
VRVVAWNSCGGTAAAAAAVRSLDADVAVLSEVASSPPAASLYDAEPDWVWAGDNPRKGVAAVGLRGKLQAPPPTEGSGRWAVAATHDSGLRVLGVWVNPFGSYTPELVLAVAANSEWLSAGPAIIAGDFNLTVGGSEDKAFRAALDTLAGLGFTSAYHATTGEPFGSESTPTHYWKRHHEPGYHVDYCFVRDASVRCCTVGTYDDWVAASGLVPGRSDHVPLIVDIDLPAA